MTKKGMTHTVTLPKVFVEINDTKYHMCFDFNAICTVEELTGINLLNQMYDLNLDKLSSKMFRALLFASLLKAQPDMTIDDAGALINPYTTQSIYPALLQAWFESMPKPSEEELKNVLEPETK